MSTPANWESHLAPSVPWQEAYKWVEINARASLSELPAGAEITTTALVGRLYAGDSKQTKDRVFKALKSLAGYGLKDCWRSATELGRNKFGREVMPKLWHRPAGHTCPQCDGKGWVP